MKRLFAAIASMLKSSVSFVWDRCAATGAWTLRAVASIGGGGAVPAVASEVVDPEYGTAADLIPEDDGSVDRLLQQSKALLSDIFQDPESPGDGYDRIKRIASDFAKGGWGNSFDLAKLSVLQAEWLEDMTPEMHKLVGDASREELIAHMRGGKSIRGVIRCDNESIKEWKRSNEMEEARASYGIETLPQDGEPEWAHGRLAAC